MLLVHVFYCALAGLAIVIVALRFWIPWRPWPSCDSTWWEIPVLESCNETGHSPAPPLSSKVTRRWKRSNKSMVAAAAAMTACTHCGRGPAEMRCSACKCTRYCSKECQARAWKQGHKQQCSLLKKQAGAGAAKGPHSQAAGLLPTQPAAKAPDPPDEVAPVPDQVLHPYEDYLRHHSVGCGAMQPPAGLHNVGNTCFANSLLQCLLATQPLISFLGEEEHSHHCGRPTAQSWCLVCEMERLVGQTAASSGPGAAVNPKAITRQVRRIASHFTPGRQEDAHDLYLAMLAQMEGVLLHGLGGREAHPDMRSRETTFMGHCFLGYVRYQTICTACGAISQRFDTKSDLELEVSSRTDSIETGLDALFSDEQLDSDNLYKCERCKQKVQATRRSALEVGPNVLVLCLKRFGIGRYSKITRPVLYPEVLDLSPYMASGAMDAAPARYQLYGCTVHLDCAGSTASGHYVAYTRTADGRWFLCDDESVVQVTAATALQQRAYMLFYQRITPHAAPDPSLKQRGQARAADASAPALTPAPAALLHAAALQPASAFLDTAQPHGLLPAPQNSLGSPLSLPHPTLHPVPNSQPTQPTQPTTHLLQSQSRQVDSASPSSALAPKLPANGNGVAHHSNDGTVNGVAHHSNDGTVNTRQEGRGPQRQGEGSSGVSEPAPAQEPSALSRAAAAAAAAAASQPAPTSVLSHPLILPPPSPPPPHDRDLLQPSEQPLQPLWPPQPPAALPHLQSQPQPASSPLPVMSQGHPQPPVPGSGEVSNGVSHPHSGVGRAALAGPGCQAMAGFAETAAGGAAEEGPLSGQGNLGSQPTPVMLRPVSAAQHGLVPGTLCAGVGDQQGGHGGQEQQQCRGKEPEQQGAAAAACRVAGEQVMLMDVEGCPTQLMGSVSHTAGQVPCSPQAGLQAEATDTLTAQSLVAVRVSGSWAAGLQADAQQLHTSHTRHAHLPSPAWRLLRLAAAPERGSSSVGSEGGLEMRQGLGQPQEQAIQTPAHQQERDGHEGTVSSDLDGSVHLMLHVDLPGVTDAEQIELHASSLDVSVIVPGRYALLITLPVDHPAPVDHTVKAEVRGAVLRRSRSCPRLEVDIRRIRVC